MIDKDEWPSMIGERLAVNKGMVNAWMYAGCGLDVIAAMRA